MRAGRSGRLWISDYDRTELLSSSNGPVICPCIWAFDFPYHVMGPQSRPHYWPTLERVVRRHRHFPRFLKKRRIYSRATFSRCRKWPSRFQGPPRASSRSPRPCTRRGSHSPVIGTWPTRPPRPAATAPDRWNCTDMICFFPEKMKGKIFLCKERAITYPCLKAAICQ